VASTNIVVEDQRPAARRLEAVAVGMRILRLSAVRPAGLSHSARSASSGARCYQDAEKVLPGLFQLASPRRMSAARIIFQTLTCSKNGGTSLYRTAGR